MDRNGFTLVELMVVITLIGLAGAMVLLTMGGADRGPAQAAAHFASRLGAAREAAVIGGAPVGAWVSASGYGFERQAGGRWEAIETKPLASGDWARGVQARLGEPLVRIRFDALGLVERPVTIALASDGGETEVRVDSNGDILVR